MHDHKHIAAQFLRAVRGRRSQLAFSRRLGYRSNTAADWEAGRRIPTAVVALAACKRVGIDVDSAFLDFHPASSAQLGNGDDAGVARWLNALRGSTSIVALAEHMGCSRFAVSRWLSGRCKPRLSEFFGLVHAMTGRLSDLLAGLVDIELIPSLVVEHKARVEAKRLAYEEPWTAAVARLLEIEEYQSMPYHVDGWVAARLGIDIDTERRCIERMRSAGVIEQDGNRYKTSSLSVDTVATPDEMNQLKAHWTRVALTRLDGPKQEDIFSYNLMSVSAENLAEIRTVLQAAYRAVRAIAAAPQPEQVVAQVNLQMLSW